MFQVDSVPDCCGRCEDVGAGRREADDRTNGTYRLHGQLSARPAKLSLRRIHSVGVALLLLGCFMAQIPRGTLGLTDELSDTSFDNRQRGVRESSVTPACHGVTFPMPTRVWDPENGFASRVLRRMFFPSVHLQGLESRKHEHAVFPFRLSVWELLDSLSWTSSSPSFSRTILRVRYASASDNRGPT